MLTEIHRQAGESAIIRLATMARQGKPIPYGAHDGSSGRCGATDVAPEQLLRGGQVICGRNATRLQLNAAMKHAAGFAGAHPMGGGEKIICLKNRHDLGLVNGMFVSLADIERRGTARVQCHDHHRGRQSAIAGRHRFYKGHFDDHVHLDPERSRRDWKEMRGLIETVWGYAITCHKARARSGRTSSSTTTGSAAPPRIGPAGSTPRSRAPSAGWRSLIDLNDAPHPFPPQVRYDLDAIVARLRATAENWVPRLFPNGRRVGDEWRLANIKGAAAAQAGQLRHHAEGRARGRLARFRRRSGRRSAQRDRGGDGAHRDANCSRTPPNDGMVARRSDPSGAATNSSGEAGTRHGARDRLHSRSRRARSPARRRKPICRGRGLAVPDGADLLAHADLTHWETKSGYPALIGVVRDRAGELIALHRTYLQSDAAQPDKVAKAPVTKPRMMLGKNGGGAVRLAPLGESGVLALSEGIETGLAVMTACPGLAVWATLSTSGLEQVQLPAQATRIIILADHDASGAGLRAAETTARRLRAEGREVAIAMPPEAGDDFNDLLLRDGAEAVRAVIEGALPASRAMTCRSTIGQHRPINYIAPDTVAAVAARRRGRSCPRGRAGLEPAARLQPHALAVPLRRRSDLGGAGR